MPRISALTLYPVKSMRGIDVETATLTPLGLRHDRQFMVVRGNGRFVTQRDAPELALIETSLMGDGVILSRPGHGTVHVSFRHDGGRLIHTRVWKDECEALDQGDAVSDWLTDALQSKDSLRLVAMAPGFDRPQGKAKLLGANNRTLFADAAPFLVANEASLERLNHELAGDGIDPVPMNRFRPNIVLRGLPAFAEHTRASLAGKGFALRLHYPCQRCIVTTIDQATAVKSPLHEPYRTLARINPMPDRETSPAFGQNATLAHGDGCTVRRGDSLRIEDSNIE
jgi:uncharacterized protein YcbX